MIDKLQALLRVGMDGADTDVGAQRFGLYRIRTLNVLAGLASGVAILTILLAVILGEWLLIPGSLLLISIMVGVFHLQANHRFYEAALTMTLLANIVVTGQFVYLGPDFGVHYWFLPLTLFPFVYFPASARLTPGSLGALSVGLMSLIGVLDQRHHQLPANYLATEVLAAVFVLVLGFTFRRYLLRSELQVEVHQDWMEDQADQLSTLNIKLADQVEVQERQRGQLDREARGRIEAQQYFVEHMTRVAGLTELSALATQQTTERGLLEACTRVARRVTGAEYVELVLLDESGARFRPIMLHPSDPNEDAQWVSERAVPWVREILEEGKQAIQDTQLDDASWAAGLAEDGLRSAMALPIYASGTAIGVLRAAARFSEQFDPSAQDLVFEFASTIGTNLALLRSLKGLESDLDRADAVLVSVLPPAVSKRLKGGDTGFAERVSLAGVFFCDLVGFTAYSSGIEPEAVVDMLQGAFAVLEANCAKHQVEKIKTIGDAFMAVAGVSVPVEDPVKTITEFSLSSAKALEKHFAEQALPLGFRIGIHAGPVLAGVIGRERLFFDIWGDTVNFASRLENSGQRGEVRCSDRIRADLGGSYVFEDCGRVELKGKGAQQIWRVLAPGDASGEAVE
jgi:class 3 adenylate cyclase